MNYIWEKHTKTVAKSRLNHHHLKDNISNVWGFSYSERSDMGNTIKKQQYHILFKIINPYIEIMPIIGRSFIWFFLCYNKMLWSTFFSICMESFIIILSKWKKQKTFSEKLASMVIYHILYVKPACKTFNISW